MSSDFWNKMAVLWCKQVSSTDMEQIVQIANAQAEKDQKSKSGYSLNPLDDDEEDDDFI